MADMPILLMRNEMSGTGEGGQTAGCINAGMPSPLSSGIGSMGWSMGEQASGGFNAGMPSPPSSDPASSAWEAWEVVAHAWVP